MRIERLAGIITIVIMVFALAACGSSESAPEEEAAADDGQNPVMNYVGDYACDRATIHVEAAEGNKAEFLVTWGSSVSETSEWKMSGDFDTETNEVMYNDCVRTDYVYKEDGSVESEEQVYFNGHGVIKFQDGEGTLTWQDDQEDAAKDMVFEYVTYEDPGAGMANPWSEADSIEEAAKGAGLDIFTFVEGMTISLGDANVEAYRYMDGIAELDIPFPAVDMTIRKGKASAAAEKGDISGDYGEYKYTWTQNIKGLEVTCSGNRKGEATKTIWGVDDCLFSITAFGMGGDEDYGFSPDDINSLVNGIQ